MYTHIYYIHNNYSIYINMVAIPFTRYTDDYRCLASVIQFCGLFGNSAWKHEDGSLLTFSRLLLPLFRELIEG